jgi:hypothetical protein
MLLDRCCNTRQRETIFSSYQCIAQQVHIPLLGRQGSSRLESQHGAPKNDAAGDQPGSEEEGGKELEAESQEIIREENGTYRIRQLNGICSYYVCKEESVHLSNQSCPIRQRACERSTRKEKHKRASQSSWQWQENQLSQSQRYHVHNRDDNRRGNPSKCRNLEVQGSLLLAFRWMRLESS